MLDHKLNEACHLQIVSTSDYKENKSKAKWKVEPSFSARNCRNFIREIVDNLNLRPNPEKNLISLSIGDPTIYGNLKPADETIEAVIKTIEEGTCNGYAPSIGYEKAREAVAQYLSVDGVQVQTNDVILCSGCSSSIEMCITALADGNRGDNIVIPRPGFPIYRTLAETIRVSVRYYDLNPEDDWKVDLAHLESQIDINTAAIVLNNPSNPCGCVYDEEHLRSILKIAKRRRVPIIADEIYERLVWSKKFVSVAALHYGVPVLICGGLAKRFLVPGWRLGWIIVHDEIGAMDDIRKYLIHLSQRTIGSNTLIQGALPSILQNTPKSFHDELCITLQRHACVMFDGLRLVKGLTPIMPEGTMYMLIKVNLGCFPQFKTGLDFMSKMVEEESVFCLPGECFQLPQFMRIVLTVPENLLIEACARIAEFCNRHFIEDDGQ